MLDTWVDRTAAMIAPGSLRDVIVQLKQRPTFEQQWPDSYAESLSGGKARINKIDSIRNSKITLDDILKQDKDLYDWYQSIS